MTHLDGDRDAENRNYGQKPPHDCIDRNKKLATSTSVTVGVRHALNPERKVGVQKLCWRMDG